jgi:hypothetical protein
VSVKPHALCCPLWCLELLTRTILFVTHLTNRTAETRSKHYFLRYHSHDHQNFTTMSLAFVYSIGRITIIDDESVASVPHGCVCTSKAGDGRTDGRTLNAKLSLCRPCTYVGDCSWAANAFIIPLLDGSGRQALHPGRFTSGDRAPCMHCAPI